MKKLFILAIAAMIMTACTKENPVIGTWEAYKYQNGSNVTVPHFNLIFTETDCTLQSTFDAQSATGSYTISGGVLSVYWIDKPSVFNIEISGDVMRLTNEYETIMLRRI